MFQSSMLEDARAKERVRRVFRETRILEREDKLDLTLWLWYGRREPLDRRIWGVHNGGAVAL